MLISLTSLYVIFAVLGSTLIKLGGLEKYKIFGFSDLKIIELYFIENGIEDKGVELMNSLSLYYSYR